MRLRTEWSAPANVLLAGEYAITRPGGTGLAVATNPRGYLGLYELEGPVDGGTLPVGVTGTGSITVVTVTSGAPVVHSQASSVPLVDAVLAGILEEGAGPDGPGSDSRLSVNRHWRIEIDTGAFFDETTGAKLGLGSSAVATLLLTAALREIADVEAGRKRNSNPEFAAEVVPAAIQAHRRVHGGRSSGYDIVTSAVGGAVQFSGGEVPTWKDAPFLVRFLAEGGALYTWNNNSIVLSATAVGCFDSVISPGSAREREFIRENNGVIDEIKRADGWRKLFTAISKAGELGVSLGSEIGVPAKLPFPGSHRDDGWISKASGAGNERAVIFVSSTPRRPLPRGAVSLPLQTEGLVRCRH
jgi:mevalonate kinase